MSFFHEYRVLARLVGTLTDFWVEATHKFLWCLESDWWKIQQTFQGETDLDQVVAVWPFLSNRHHNGRTAIAIQFVSGLKLIYKPKDLGLKAAYFQLLDWLNQYSSPFPFKLFKVMNRSTHGWVEYVEQLLCRDISSICLPTVVIAQMLEAITLYTIEFMKAIAVIEPFGKNTSKLG